MPEKRSIGLSVSIAAHACLLGLTLVAFSAKPELVDVQENIPVEMITDQAFSQIAKGEKAAKVTKPIQKAEKISDLQELKPAPPVAEAKKDVPLPPPSLRHLPDPGEDDTPKQAPPEKTAVVPPPVLPAPPVQPPVRPMEAKPAPEPPARPQPPKEITRAEPEEQKPEDAGLLTPKPAPRPKTEIKPVPKPPEKVAEKAEEKPVAKPPERPRLKPDQVARLLDSTRSDNTSKTDKPASKPKSGDEQSEPKQKFNAADISRLLDRDRPQARPSTGREVVHTASLGAPDATAQKMSPNMMDGLNSYLMERYKQCWTYFGAAAGRGYIPRIRVRYNANGSLSADPLLVNPTSDPALTSLASAAMNTVRTCKISMPQQFLAYYEQWKSKTFDFDPEQFTR